MKYLPLWSPGLNFFCVTFAKSSVPYLLYTYILSTHPVHIKTYKNYSSNTQMVYGWLEIFIMFYSAKNSITINNSFHYLMCKIALYHVLGS